MSGYAYQMNAALDKIKEMMRINAELKNKYDALVLENASLHLALEDAKMLCEENVNLKQKMSEYISRIEKAAKWR